MICAVKAYNERIIWSTSLLNAFLNYPSKNQLVSNLGAAL
jgi:hypothetical protein